MHNNEIVTCQLVNSVIKPTKHCFLIEWIRYILVMIFLAITIPLANLLINIIYIFDQINGYLLYLSCIPRKYVKQIFCFPTIQWKIFLLFAMPMLLLMIITTLSLACVLVPFQTVLALLTFLHIGVWHMVRKVEVQVDDEFSRIEMTSRSTL